MRVINPCNIFAHKESVTNPAISASPDGQHLLVIHYYKRHAPDNLPDAFVGLYMVQSYDGGTTRSTDDVAEASRLCVYLLLISSNRRPLAGRLCHLIILPHSIAP